MASKSDLVERLSGLGEQFAVRRRRNVSVEEYRRERRDRRREYKRRERERQEQEKKEKELERIKLLNAYEQLDTNQKALQGLYVTLRYNNSDQSEKFVHPGGYDEALDLLNRSLMIIQDLEPSSERRARVYRLYEPLIKEALEAGEIDKRMAEHFLKFPKLLERSKRLNLPADFEEKSIELAEEDDDEFFYGRSH